MPRQLPPVMEAKMLDASRMTCGCPFAFKGVLGAQQELTGKGQGAPLHGQTAHAL